MASSCPREAILGLRPPEEGAVPGCYKLPWALRDRGLVRLLGAEDAGSVVPPRYRSQWRPGDGDRNAAAIGAAGGEALAIVTGRGDARLVDLDGLGPYVRDEDVCLVGVRSADEYLGELAALGIRVATSAQVRERGVEGSAEEALDAVARGTDGFWVHLDLDVVDASQMPAVDCPEPDGLSFAELGRLLARLVRSPGCVGVELTIYDPDLDPTGSVADAMVECLGVAFRDRPLG